MKKKINSIFSLVVCFLFTQIYADRPGLQNLGNSCYFNSTIQCLASCKPLNDLFKKNSAQYEKDSITSKYLSLIDEIHAEKDRDPNITPSPLKILHTSLTHADYTGWGYSQQDASELLSWALTSQFGDIEHSKDHSPTELGKILSMGITSTIWHGNMIHPSSTVERLFPVSIEIKGNSLLTCLDNFFRIEELDEKSPFDCEKCLDAYNKDKTGNKTTFLTSTQNKKNTFFIAEETDPKKNLKKGKLYVTTSKKQLLINNCSKIFCIHLKRFAAGNVKINDPISFPLNLKIKKEWVDTNFKETLPDYSLIAFSTHGGGTGGGHYWAHAKDWRDGKWYHLNDSSSVSIPEDKASQEKNAYILFYQKTNTLTPTSPLILPKRNHLTGDYNQPRTNPNHESTKILQEKLSDLDKSMGLLKENLKVFSEKLGQLNTQLKAYNS